jgi:hypothetical protein
VCVCVWVGGCSYVCPKNIACNSDFPITWLDEM